MNLATLTIEQREEWIFEEGISQRELHRRLMECYSYICGTNPLLLTGKAGLIYLPPQQMCCIQPLDGDCNCSDESVIKIELREVIQMSFHIHTVKATIAEDDFATFALKGDWQSIDCELSAPISNEKVDVTIEVSYLAIDDIYWNGDSGRFDWTLQLTCQYKNETHVVEPEFELEIVG